eukprot:CAMPEP_0184557362 /NCGR_PEP_ID=MMETSP0199_2-20130426/42544_1 /TAXON_ID=1112570 /ORGANISM="Thraustochytrium sp., Strain LLF1b" /LENGTH=104 /DNA_ID=CAMNT_0026954269 /DNA_START=36 /DNA_END=347 /DNA_ORIENTATION=-
MAKRKRGDTKTPAELALKASGPNSKGSRVKKLKRDEIDGIFGGAGGGQSSESDSESEDELDMTGAMMSIGDGMDEEHGFSSKDRESESSKDSHAQFVASKISKD